RCQAASGKTTSRHSGKSDPSRYGDRAKSPRRLLTRREAITYNEDGEKRREARRPQFPVVCDNFPPVPRVPADASRSHPLLLTFRGATMFRAEPGRRGSVMLPTSVRACAGVDDTGWKQGWLDNFPCDMPSSVPYPRVPLYTLLEHAAARFPDRPACTLYGKATTYAQLADQSRRFARALRDLGAGPGKFVGLLLPNIPEYLVALQAVWLTGATALQLSPLMVHDEVAHWLKATDCRTVVTLD